MNKPLKIILGIVGGVISLVLIALVTAVLMFDPNSFRGKLSAEIKDRYHRDLAVDDIKLGIFPWLHVKISNVKVSNGEGFSKDPFAQVGELELGVALMPLLKERKVEATAITVTDLTLNLEKDGKGASNWADFMKADDKKDEKDDQDKSNSIELKNVNISGVDLRNITLHYSDAQSGKRYAVDHLNFKTGALKVGEPFDIESSLALSSKSPEALIDLKLKTTVLANFDAKTYSLSNLKLDADLSGGAVPGGKQSVQLTGGAFFDQGKGTFLLSKAELQAAGITVNTDITGTGITGDSPRLSGPIKIKPFSPRDVMSKLGMKPPVTADKDALNSVSLNAQYMGTFKSASLSGLALVLDQTNITGSLNVSDFASKAIRFALKADKLDADRYMAPKADKAASTAKETPSEAAAKKAALNATKIPSDALNALNVNGTLDIGTFKVSGVNMNSVHLGLSGAPGSAKQQELSANLYGGSIKANTRVNGNSYAVTTKLQGLNAAPFLKDLTGKDAVSGVGNLNLDVTANGATVGDVRRSLNGSMNFAVENGAVKGFNLGQIIRKARATVSGQQLSADDAAEQKTDFATLTASGKFTNGVLKSDDLNAKNPLLRLTGAGEIDLVNETINYTAKPTVVETSAGQGGKELDALSGVTIPIELTGNLYAPKYRVLFGDIAKQQATKQLTKQFDAHQEEIQKKLNDKLGTDLGGQLGGALGKLFGSKKTTPTEPATPPADQAPATTTETKPGT